MAEPDSLLELPAAIRDAIFERGRNGSPREVCGILGGRFGRERSVVRSQYPVENAAGRPRRRYRIDPETALEVFERLAERGEEIVGFYHSHPRGPLEPSGTDVNLATWPDRSYVIVSLENGGKDSECKRNRSARIGSWRWRETDGGRFERERVVLAGPEE